MSTILVAALLVLPLLALLQSRVSNSTTTNLQQGLAKAWAKWDASSTVTLDDSLNTTSITDNGTGDFEQNLTNSMNNADYSVTATIKFYHVSKDATVSTTSMFPIFCTSFPARGW